VSRLRSSYLAALIASGLVAGCGGDGGNEPPPADMTTAVSKSSTGSGDAQNGTVGQPLGAPLQVVVTVGGQPSSGVTVAWSTTAAGGSMTPPSGPTNTDGVASSTWSLGTAAGAQSASATVAGAAGSPVTFTASAAAGPAATIDKAGGDGQSGETNTQLALPLQARVTDQFGNGAAGVGVDWSATGAAVSAPTVATDAGGISQTSITLGGTAGPITIVAESNGLAGSPLSFSATAVEPAPIPASVDVTVRNDNFLSERNGTLNPAVDTVQVGGTVTWTWAASATNPHDVTSSGSPTFTSSATTAQPFVHGPITFPTAGTYIYYCTQHGVGAPTPGGMWGRIVVR